MGVLPTYMDDASFCLKVNKLFLSHNTVYVMETISAYQEVDEHMATYLKSFLQVIILGASCPVVPILPQLAVNRKTCCDKSHCWSGRSTIGHSFSCSFPWRIVWSIIEHNDRQCNYLWLVLGLIFFNSTHGVSYDQLCDNPKNNCSLRLHSQVIENSGH